MPLVFPLRPRRSPNVRPGRGPHVGRRVAVVWRSGHAEGRESNSLLQRAGMRNHRDVFDFLWVLEGIGLNFWGSGLVVQQTSYVGGR